MAATVDNRYVEVKAYGYSPSSEKLAADVYLYTFDFTTWLAGADTVTSASASVSPGTGGPPTLGSPAVITGGLLVTLLVTGGTGGYKGTISVKGTTTNGQQKTQSVAIHITPDP